MTFDIIASGHICLDLYPSMDDVSVEDIASPGKLFEIGALEISTGGSVSNTGLAIHRLGANVGFMTIVGNDMIGQMIIASLNSRDPSLGELVTIRSGSTSSYSVLLSPGNADRIILHCTGTNEQFGNMDIDYEMVKNAKIFHLGYPPLLPQLYANDGEQLLAIYQHIKSMGVVTSLDMALPDPSKAGGQVDWATILRKTLPSIDIFLPSLEEIMFMLRREDYDNWGAELYRKVTKPYLRDLADELLDMGSVVVGLKLGEYGMMIKTGSDFGRLDKLVLEAEQWSNIELWHPAFKVSVVGTTGAGDSAYGAFLVAMLRGLPPQGSIQMACAVGSSNTEAHDATSGIQSWENTRARIEAGWQTLNKSIRDV